MIWHFSDLHLDLSRRSLSRNGEIIHLTNLSFLTLKALVEASPRLLGHDELIREVWGADRIVTPENLTQRIKVLRESLGDDAEQPRYIESVRGQGFRLIPEVIAADVPSGPIPEVQKPAPRRWLISGISAIVVIVVLAGFLSKRFSPSDERITTSPATDAADTLPKVDLLSGVSVAVLPFVNMSDDPNNEFFSDGMAEEIINTLVRETTLPVIARTSSFQFKHDPIDGKEIGRRLGASHLLEGSVRKTGQRVRITAQLIDAPSSFHLWSQQYDRKLDDLFEIQTEIAMNIATEIKRQLEAQGESRMKQLFVSREVTPREAMSAPAYEAYLKGLQHQNRQLPGDIVLAREYFQQAVQLAPHSEQTWKEMMLTELQASTFHMGITTPADAYSRIEEWLAIAHPKFPDNIYMQILHGWTLAFNQYRWAEGLEVLAQTHARATGNALALSLLGNAYTILAEQELAIEILEQAHRINPDLLYPLHALGLLYVQAGRQNEAIALPQPVGYDYFNAINAATVNILLLRGAEVDRNIRIAKQHVSSDHATIRSLESQLLKIQRDNESASVIELALIENMRETPITVGWVAPIREDALVIAEEQRQANPLQWIMLAYGQGWPLQEDLKPFVEKMKLIQMPERKRGRGLLLSEAERQAIASSEISVPTATLESYVGVYQSGDNRLTIDLKEGQLHYMSDFRSGKLGAVSENEFISTTERDFSLELLANEAGVNDLCIWRDGQWVHYGYNMGANLP